MELNLIKLEIEEIDAAISMGVKNLSWSSESKIWWNFVGKKKT